MEIYRRAWIRNGLSQAEFDKAEDGLRIAVAEALIDLEEKYRDLERVCY